MGCSTVTKIYTGFSIFVKQLNNNIFSKNIIAPFENYQLPALTYVLFC